MDRIEIFRNRPASLKFMEEDYYSMAFEDFGIPPENLVMNDLLRGLFIKIHYSENFDYYRKRFINMNPRFPKLFPELVIEEKEKELDEMFELLEKKLK